MTHEGSTKSQYIRENIYSNIYEMQQRAMTPASGSGRAKIALLGGFRPRKCGIATFTTDLFEQLTAFQSDLAVQVYALRSANDPGANDPDVHHYLRDDDRAAFREAARRMNEECVDAVWIQHEYGIFGGPDGEYVLDLVDRVAAPVILTLHTILETPSERQRAILDRLIAKASQIMVMSHEGRQRLERIYGADARRVRVIEHGAPDRPFGRQAQFKAALGLENRTVMMTFGLLGPGKGLETVIRAMPAIVDRHPQVVYRIVGATHPNLVAQEGEAYRERLQAMADELGVAAHIEWDNRFLDTGELLDQLEACDIYVTPYPNLQQSTSGTLSYAVALGKAVISTPYVHACELLGGNCGLFMPVEDPEALAVQVKGLLDEPENLTNLQRRAYARGRQTIWPRFAEAAGRLIRDTVAERARAVSAMAHAGMPGITAISLMTDATGMLQHGLGVVADRNHGYCLDDNVRALMLMNVASDIPADQRLAWSHVFASFTQHGWNEDRGVFRNFMRFDRSWCEEQGSEDSNGRAIWCIGHTARYGVTQGLRDWGGHWFDRSAAQALRFMSPRAMAFAMLGAGHMLDVHPDHGLAREIMEKGGAFLCEILGSSRRPAWTWFETVIAYDNARLPEALMRAGELCGQSEWLAEGLATLDWMCRQQMAGEGYFRPAGSDSFGREGEVLPFDQQPVEAWATIDACTVSYRLDPSAKWVKYADKALNWFMGANDRSCVLADMASGLCKDGINSRGVNENCGAESILAFQIGYRSHAGLKRNGAIPNDRGEELIDGRRYKQPA